MESVTLRAEPAYLFPQHPEYKLAVMIGRFEPPHKSHLKVILDGFKEAEAVLVILGSHRSTPTVKNPWTAEQRKEMIEAMVAEVNPLLLNKLHIELHRDYYLQDPHWVAKVQNIVYSKYAEEGDSIALLGSWKDQSSYYINYFRSLWQFLPSKCEAMDATEVRDKLFSLAPAEEWKALLPPAVSNWIEKNYIEPVGQGWQDKGPAPLGFAYMVDQYKNIQEHKEIVHKFPRNEVTVDAVVIQSGHVAVVTRKGRVGKGLFALPGGYVKTDEFIRDAAIRELKEETRIKVDVEDLKTSVIGEKYFDYPKRSQLGRVITHAFAIRLKDGRLAEMRGGDDAAAAMWMSFADVELNEDKFFDDHVHIIRWALRRAGEHR